MQPSTKNLHVSLSSADELIWEGDALSVSSENKEGKFDVLPGHANFITMISGKPITVRISTTEEQRYNYRSAVLYTLEDRIKIYVNI